MKKLKTSKEQIRREGSIVKIHVQESLAAVLGFKAPLKAWLWPEQLIGAPGLA